MVKVGVFCFNDVECTERGVEGELEFGVGVWGNSENVVFRRVTLSEVRILSVNRQTKAKMHAVSLIEAYRVMSSRCYI